MLRVAFAIALVFAFNGSALAKTDSSKFVAACMKLDNGTPKNVPAWPKDFPPGLMMVNNLDRSKY